MERRDAFESLMPLFAVLLVALVIGPLIRRVATPRSEPPTVLLAP